MAYTDKLSGADELRSVVNWIDWQREGFNAHFTADELVRLWRYGMAHPAEVNEFADTWTDEQIEAAIGRPCPWKDAA
jgi:hypothetical protein